MEQTKICPECGAHIGAYETTCPFCGYPLEQPAAAPGYRGVLAAQKAAKTRRTVGALMCIAAAICIIVGITRVTNTQYKFYVEHLEECREGYEDAKAAARNSIWYASSYNNIADAYKTMIENDEEELRECRTHAVVLCGAGVVLAVFGVMNIKKGGAKRWR